ncbi:hypothetical protein GCM10008927_10230 [Amylibacter ulvae]|uniref:Uncharacterized protein n=1 Tax=Paramylibacter ulvae TaxID=1651968 RepID=A0ABQ3CWX5_9RHOB|nr:hypothetical protein [Amylibacter ulvae]GHA47368.1 hypothetical protein GCM10008927_10230 [Amylibacter ulvae]
MKCILSGLLICIANITFAGEAVVTNVVATPQNDSYRFDVTLSHTDTGWDHYADGWGVYLADGTELGYRELLHPHVNEQPFTRSLSGVKIPDGTTSVTIKPRDNVHGVGADFKFTLP